MEHALKEGLGLSKPGVDKDKTTIREVFIPEHLSYIARFLGDEDVPIRFVCKQTHENLSNVQPSMKLALQSSSQKPVGKKDQARRDENAIIAARPYMTSISLLKWAKETLDMPCDKNMRCASIASGSLDVVKWLRSKTVEEFPWNAYVCRVAAKYGQLDVLKWLRSQDPPCDWDKRVCSQAAANGDLKMMQWARAQDPPCPWDEKICKLAAQFDHLDLLKWVRSQDPPCPWNIRKCIDNVPPNGVEMRDWLVKQERETM